MSEQKLNKILSEVEKKYPLEDVIKGEFGDLIEDTILDADITMTPESTCIYLSDNDDGIFEYDHNNISGYFTRTLI